MEIVLENIKTKKFERSTLIYIPFTDYKLWASNKLITTLNKNLKLLWCGEEGKEYLFKIFKGYYVDNKYIKTEEKEITANELKSMLNTKESTHRPKYIEPIYNQEAIDELKY